ncbi:cation:proton antiporter [Halorientalis brevis]|uniref:Cation:proton antiporter n=1 Tax=Halorientalis brevis TaxID=1126241 RepID=A0ABD6CHX0_9EURY|nr:cation:proton antiporter [Halorientalis brevis]
MAPDALLAVSVIVAFAAVSKLIGDWYQLPSVVFLLGFGVLLGPEGVGFLSASLSSSELSAVVGFAVAVIVFEGAFSLSLHRIRTTPKPTLLLVTVGAAITFLGLGLTVRFVLGLQWTISLVISALLVATGPTVITPILEQITVTERVASLLEAEGIINDVSASVLGSALFTVTLLSKRAGRVETIVTEFVSQVGVGMLFGVVLALASSYVLRAYSRSPQDSRVVILAVALLTYSLATLFGDESGVVAVAVAGLVMGNQPIPYQAEIARFGSAISTIVLGTVYIVLAALIRFEEIFALGLGGLVVVLVAMFVVRPLSVFVSTYDSEFSTNERAFISAIGPRGIIPAATATLFSLQLARAGVPNASSVVSLVFLVILVTVVVEAGGAPFLANAFGIIPMTTLIIGGGVIGRQLAAEIDARGGNPVIVERDEATVADLRAAAYSVVQGDGTNADVLAEAGVENATRVVATTSDDAVNILACQTARTKFGVESLVSLANDPTKVESFEDLGIATLTPSAATVDAISDLVTLPSLSAWRASTRRREHLAEGVVSETVDGTRVADLDLPPESMLVLLQRDDEFLIPSPDVVLQAGDRVTVLGQSDAVESALTRLTA